MGFLKKALKGEGLSEDIEGISQKEDGYDELEERYMRMYMKIARDFIHKEDVLIMFKMLLEHLDIEEDEFDLSVIDSIAQQRAEEYKHFLKNNDLGSNYYPDILEIGEE